jgi:putative NIF3 family GTP cyclohydrolase 1 type 2
MLGEQILSVIKKPCLFLFFWQISLLNVLNRRLFSWLFLQSQIKHMPQLTEIRDFLDSYLQVTQYPHEQNGIWKPTATLVRKMGIVLEPWPQLYLWIQQYHLDTLFVHRPWKLDLSLVPASTGVLSYHLAFDEKLTVGYNPLLAAQLGMTSLESLGEKEGRPLGMTGIILPTTIELFTAKIESLFGLPEQINTGKTGQINKIAVMGAMTEKLILAAAQKGVHLYLTGQFRKPAARAVEQTGLHVITTGHWQSERFGLHTLEKLLTDKWPHLQVYKVPT